MSEMSFDDAAGALSAAANAPEPATPGFESPAAPATSTPAPSTEVDAGTTPATPAESFTNVDPNTLPPELQAQYRSMQGDYTRKTQELAQKFGDLDPERARQSVEFINALESDPNFVVTVHQQLSKALEDAGMSPAQAAQSAASAIQEQTSLGGEDPEELGADSGLAREVAELRQWKEQQEAQQYESNLAAHLQRQEMGIRQADPSLTEPEIDRIYELAFAHGGDLTKAHASYSNWKNEVMTSYIERKDAQPTPAAPASTGFAEVPRTGHTFEEGHQMAKEMLRNALAND